MKPSLLGMLLIMATFALVSCASHPEKPTTTTYNRQVNQQAQEEFDRTINPY